MFLLHSTILITALGALGAATVDAPTPTIKKAYGTFLGTPAIEGVDSFLGIRYAQPPLDDLRFQPPQPLNETKPYHTEPNGTIFANSFGPGCYQIHYTSLIMPQNLQGSMIPDEDCLFLNIWRPSNVTGDDAIPVMIWLYGGSFSEGDASVAVYNPEILVQQNPSVMVVTFNYRLGIFGFPNSKARRGNLGLLDQRMAVEWVRDNIRAFGGDPDQMVLFGESAGAVSISAYSYTYKDDPIVRGLIQQSGVAQGIGDADPLMWTLAAINVGCNNTDDPSKELSCMMQLPAETIIKGISPSNVNPIGSANGGSPFVDNNTVFSAEGYIAKAERGDFAKIPVLLGSNDDEGNGVVNFSGEFGLNESLADAITVSKFTCPVAMLARQLHDNQVPVWRYRYMPVFPAVTFYPFSETYHLSEVPIILGSFRKLVPYQTPTKVELQASQLMQKAWVSFAHDPRYGLSRWMEWPMYNPDEPTLITLFQDNKFQVKTTDQNVYDRACTNPPSVSWEDVAAPPPGPTS
ncbi:uncharacterized protein Z518_04424 [Rhinocladiella mackenziei CBS 650.93]|uniref:Carboxylic ester hydrolase n=1 Tax=Rhinocladiella mackenziei CBS 650.93 TaxID=1442369 RepID=A0A0D2H7S5_9EURO|nr:uncharacterized protein Z518_04424 [Rhinocladiella mackenziei CBS 650.93]KIX06448.1 hypothetical protein Z518_04424 [Rhinocladiella mackenziei CBS 650.93]